MHYLLSIAAITSAAPLSASGGGHNFVRVLEPAFVSEREWGRADHRTERTVPDQSGRNWRLLIIEFE